MSQHRVRHVITTIQRGGAEKQLLVLVREQIKAGWDVEVYFLKNEPELSQEFLQAGAKVNGQAANLGLVKQIIELRKISRDSSTIIHAHLPQSELLMAMVCQHKNFLVTRHNAEEFYPSSKRWVSRVLAKFVARRAAFVITISDAVTTFNIENKQILKRDIHKLKRIYYGYPENPTEPPHKIKSERFIFGTISRLVPQKDLPTLLYAFAQIAQQYPNSELRIAGVGYLEKELKQMAITLGLNQKIKWVGKISDVESFLGEIDAFVLTSKYEGFGLVLLEAMAANLPIIASRNSAIPEVLGEKGGLFFETGNFKSLNGEMDRVIKNYSLEELGLEPLQRLREFSPLIMARLTTGIYHKVIESTS